jgi:TonB family protein
MIDLGRLSHCIMDSDPGMIRRARRIRGRALAASLLLEMGAVAAMLLWPLITPGVLPPRMEITPLPPFHGTRNPNVTPPRPGVDGESRRPRIPSPVFRQPPSIPRHISDRASPEPPDFYGMSNSDAPGIEIPGAGDNIIRIVPPTPPARSTKPLMMSSTVMSALLVNRVEPEYPAAAKMLRISGTVELRAIIGSDGAVHGLETVSGNIMLAQAARAAVMQWRYQPTQLNGKAVEVETIITVNFLLQ